MVTADQKIYILHSRECFESGLDLRECLFSQALDNGVERDSWANHENIPVALGISDGQLEALGHHAHLMDSDDNAAERVRRAIRAGEG
ncbi:hypothetical protein EV580_1337 [Mycobacterium sp. BK086]|nr:hypothetical protein EV580_1337 [Mycobacterium sp. BK086]